MNEQHTLLHDDLIWCLRRLPDAWRALLKERAGQLFVAGGFVRSVIANEKINDVDFFCPNADIAAACALALSDNGKNRVIRTENAYTVLARPFTAQFIHRWTFETPEDCIASFDFTIAKGAFWYDKTQDTPGYTNGTKGRWCSCIDPRFYGDLAAKRLVYTSPVRNEEAGGSLLRMLKFYQRGYRIPLDSMGACIARLVMAVDQKKITYGDDTPEERWAKVLTGLLREVDPNVDPTHEAHLPSMTPARHQIMVEGQDVPPAEDLLEDILG